MRVSNYNLSLAVNALCLVVFLLMSGCSISNDSSSGAAVKSNASKTINGSAKTTTKETSFKHSHASNPCTQALEHSHVFNDEDHQHSYDCENTNKFVSNAHVHKATKKTRRFRHVHPNGSNEHSHHKE